MFDSAVEELSCIGLLFGGIDGFVRVGFEEACKEVEEVARVVVEEVARVVVEEEERVESELDIEDEEVAIGSPALVLFVIIVDELGT